MQHPATEIETPRYYCMYDSSTIHPKLDRVEQHVTVAGEAEERRYN